MSNAAFITATRDAADTLREAAADILWRQWATVGAMAAASAVTDSIVDPEALVLMSLTMSTGTAGDARLRELTAGWGQVNAPLLSVQRIGNLAREYPEHTRMQLLPELAQLWIAIAKDHRWKSIANAHSPLEYGESKSRSVETPMHHPGALMLRLRRAFGVGLRADVLSFLLGGSARPQSVRAISIATGYTQAPLRRAVNDMTAAGLLDQTDAEGPDRFTINASRWVGALKLRPPLPVWAYWNDLFRITLALTNLRPDPARALGRSAFGALGRDVLQQHRVTLARAGYDPTSDVGDSVAAVQNAMMTITNFFRAAV